MPKKLNLAVLPTQIEELQRFVNNPKYVFLAKQNIRIFVKRDDNTGCGLTGNKVRKLDFLLAEALDQQCDSIIAVGAVQSNFTRAASLCARRLGLSVYLYLRGEQPSQISGNLFLDQWLGCTIFYASPEEFDKRHQWMINKEKELIHNNEIKKAYKLDVGGSSPLGCWGYIECIKEIYDYQKREKLKFSHIVCAVGSGGTIAGLALGARMFNLEAEIIGINVSNTAQYFKKVVDDLISQSIQKFKFDFDSKSVKYQVIDGFVGEGYGIGSSDQYQLMHELSIDEGIIFDQVYSGKAFYGLIQSLKQNNNIRTPKNSKILFIHTGGLFSMLDSTDKFVFKQQKLL